MPVVQAEKDRSLNIGIVAAGQAGSKVAEVFYNLGYQTVAFNTAGQDLKFINIPERQKLLLDYALQGAGKQLEVGEAAFNENKEAILNLVTENLDNCDVLLVVTSLGGGTGSGSAPELAKLLSTTGKPLVFFSLLPLTTEDSLAKHNSVQTLSKLANLAATNVISSLTIVDNAKIDLIYPNQSIGNFWKLANNAIAETLDVLNKISSQPSAHVSLDSMDFAQVLLAGDCALFGSVEVKEEDYTTNDAAIAEAVVNNLNGGLLADGFDLSQARKAAVVMVGSARALESISASSIEYGFGMVAKTTSDSIQLYRGVYEDAKAVNDDLKVYFWLSGLGLPSSRIDALKEESEAQMKNFQAKEDNRSSNMKVDLGKTAVQSNVDKMHKQIQQKGSAISKLTGNVIDRRRR